MTVYFTSDLHVGHRRVAEIRGFDDVQSHDDWIASLFDHVRKDDQVWILGDLAASSSARALDLLGSLPGEKHLISGNHDRCHPMHRDAHRYLRRYLNVFESVAPAARRRIAGAEVFLSHFPYVRDRGETRYQEWRLRWKPGSWLLHGHTHGTEIVTKRALGAMRQAEIHVGPDAHRALVPLEAIAEIIETES